MLLKAAKLATPESIADDSATDRIRRNTMNYIQKLTPLYLVSVMGTNYLPLSLYVLI
jgi:hypothetical protein